MKTLQRTSAAASGKRLLRSLFVLLVLVLLSSAVSAQTGTEVITGTARVSLKENAVKNLINNISSVNEGVRRSSIYYAGYYRVKEAMKPLVERYRKEKDPDSRVLIVLSLYKIDEHRGLDMIEAYAKADPNARVRRMFNAAYMERTNNDHKFAVE